MKQRHLILTSTFAIMAAGSACGATISDGGSLTPSSNILTGDSTAGNLGIRPITWNSSQSPARGQSFTISGSSDFTVQAIWVQVSGGEDFSLWTTNSLTLKLLGDPATRSTIPLGDYDYDATGLGTVDGGNWLRLGLDSGATLSAGTEYSFLLSPNEENSIHSVNLTRQKTGNVYSGGSELNSSNLYDRDTWDSDPWGDAVGNAPVKTSTSNIFFYVEGTAVPEPCTALLGGLGMLTLLRRRRR